MTTATIVETKDETIHDGASTLMVHAGGDTVTRESLSLLPDKPNKGKNHVSVRHDNWVDDLEKVLYMLNRPMLPETLRIALSKDAGKMFGLVRTEGEDIIPGEAGLVVGFQTSNDCTISSRVNAGVDVFVCDNLCMQGGEWIIRRKSTKNRNLKMTLFEGLEKFFEEGIHIKGLIENAREVKVSEEGAKALFWDSYRKKLVPQKFFPIASDFYFDGRHGDVEAPECEQYKGTLWGIHNAFTRALKSAPLFQRVGHTKALGSLLAG